MVTKRLGLRLVAAGWALVGGALQASEPVSLPPFNSLEGLDFPGDINPLESLPREIFPPPEPQFSFPAAADSAPVPASAVTENTLCVEGFDIIGSTVFSAAQLNSAVNQALAAADVPAPGVAPDCPQGQPLTFDQILLARTAITQLYVDQGYTTSGAIIPADTAFTDGQVPIQVIEGRLEEIIVNGTQRLDPGYISSRLAIAAVPPLNVERLLTGLQLLQQDPLIDTLSADLQQGIAAGTSRLVIDVAEADSFRVEVGLDNSRSPSIGSVRRQVGLREGNLLGLGDALTLGYANTDGSNEISTSYTLPLNPYNGVLQLAARWADNQVIEAPFQELRISSDSSEYSLTLRQPMLQTPQEQLDLGVVLSQQFNQTFLGIDNIGAFPIAPGADDQGRSVSTALRFFQAWTWRSTEQVVSLRSQFSVGLGDFLGGTVNDSPALPDSRFFAWQGQGQWVQRLGADSLLLLRGSAQIAAEPLLSAEQFGLGGQATVRGYRQDQLLTDSGLQASLEVRLPILRVPEVDATPVGGVLQIAPFTDVGYGWNVNRASPESAALLGAGVGLIWQQPNLGARLDWGIPVIGGNNRGTLQENGIYFSVNYSFF